MAITEIIMPKMGESIMEATVLNWLKQPGDYVEADEFILEVATDKIDTEVPSPFSGVLKEILISLSKFSTSKADRINLGSVTRIPLEAKNSLSNLSAAAAEPNAIASRIFDLPQPFSPIKTVTRPNSIDKD
jgi:2-oxoglutarate dehydrogenase E2 component (dihydrolipoamide succinyltransferase)